MLSRIPKRNAGFTLIEILLVLLIIGVLAALTVPNFTGQGEKARRSAARADIDANLATALDMYEMGNSRFPTTEQGLKALVTEPTTAPVPKKWSGPYLKKKRIPKDPWGNDYVYTCPGTHNPDSYDLSSLGADGAESQDDITNWENDEQ
jgi:general secretion pathway protein G